MAEPDIPNSKKPVIPDSDRESSDIACEWIPAFAGMTNVNNGSIDAVGNVLAIYNANSTGRGNELYYFTQDAFGNELTTSPFNGSSWGTARTAGIIEHQTGKWIDPFTGLYFFHARWYDSGVGRFVGRSDIFRGREHPYLFCHSNPLKWKDPSGTEPSPDEFEKYKNLVCKRLKEWADRNSGSGFKDFAISCSGLIRCCWEGSEAFYEWGSWKGCTRAMEDVLGILEDGIPEGCHAQEIRLGFHWTVWINCESYGSWWLDPWRLKCDNAGGFCNGHPQWNPAPTPTPNPNPSPPIPKPPTPVPPSPGVQEGMTYCTACGR